MACVKEQDLGGILPSSKELYIHVLCFFTEVPLVARDRGIQSFCRTTCKDLCHMNAISIPVLILCELRENTFVWTHLHCLCVDTFCIVENDNKTSILISQQTGGSLRTKEELAPSSAVALSA